MNEKEYTVVGLDGTEYPNINFEIIKEWYKNRIINDESLVLSPETGEWKMLKKVFDINELNPMRIVQSPPQSFTQPQFQQQTSSFNQQFPPHQNYSSPKPKSSALKIILGIILAIVLIGGGLIGFSAYFFGKIAKIQTSKQTNEKLLTELKQYEIPGNEYVDEKSGAKTTLPKDWRMLKPDNPLIMIHNKKESEQEMKRLGLSESTMLATDKLANSVLLQEVVNFPENIDRTRFFNESVGLVETEIINQSKPNTYKKLAEFSIVISNGLGKKIIFERVTNFINPNAEQFGIVDTDGVSKGQIIVMSNSKNAFIFQMWTEKENYEAAVADFDFIEKNFSMPKEKIR